MGWRTMFRSAGACERSAAKVHARGNAARLSPPQYARQLGRETARSGAMQCIWESVVAGSADRRKTLQTGKKRDQTRGCATGYETSGVRTRTGDLRAMNPLLDSVSADGAGDCESPSASTSNSPSSSSTNTRDDPDLHQVIEAWPDLPEPLRAGIVAMVHASQAEFHSAATREEERD